jgi:hypothetical protein
MSWYHKETQRAIDHQAIQGLFFVYGTIFAKLWGQSWAENMKSPRILFPSGLERGIRAFDCPLIQLFNSLDLPLFEIRDEAYITSMEWNEDGCFSVFKEGDNQLELWDHETETIYRVTYHNYMGRVVDVAIYAL